MLTNYDPEANSPNLVLGLGNDPTLQQKTELERMGRERPKVFSTALEEVLFVASMVMSMLMSEYFVSGFNIFLPLVSVELHIPDSAQVWPSSVFSLVTGSFLLPFGRIADIYGGFIVFTGGLVWYLVWTIIAGFSQNYHMLIAARALQGFGPAAFLPATMMILGKTYRPGPRKNLIFGIYGAFAPLGFYLGIIMGGITGDLLSWRWYFWLGAIIIFVVCLGGTYSIPRDMSKTVGGDMDYWGVVITVPALVLIVFALTDGAHAPEGWRTSYIIATLVLGVLLVGVATYVEGWVSSHPLLPGSLFKPKHMKTLVVSLTFAYGTWGVFMYYASFYLTNVMKYSTLQTALAFTPMAAGGVILCTVGGFTLHILPGRLLLVLSGAGYLISVLMFALIPENGSYWAYILPAMIGSTVGIDITYNVTNVFITTNVPAKNQGAAGALINTLLFLPISLFLGLADVVAAHYEPMGERTSYKAALWFGTGCAVAALVLFCFIDTGKAESQLRVEEREQGQQGKSKT
ncbi:MFS general substrate transporter [Cryphonectria parasitica EP155]|uniref:MFS general substrate transporter n=1 Tax=Cryphonectria parasitica (strain ATCC 38755 / EP155) TaxID=660469 RepID=A0A9P5CPW0_CRYP1|nr:MFS general substrate transporter [Cryphonectria parasitica EP155]KAF3766894.1 MFS general substrate transporter [Cryphonectria parasitica EP155]